MKKICRRQQVHGHPRSQHGGSRRGFAIITVVVMIAMVTACFVVLAEVFSYQIKLTNSTIARLQVDLLLTAGTQCVIADMTGRNPPIKPWTVALPTALTKKDGRLNIAPIRMKPGKMSYTLTAEFAGLHAQHVLVFRQIAGRWRLIKVSIPQSLAGRSGMTSQ